MVDTMRTLRHPEVLERTGNGKEFNIFDFAGDGVAIAREQAHAALVALRQPRGIARIPSLGLVEACWRLCCSLNRPSGVCSVMSNRYGITLNSEWIKWAAKRKHPKRWRRRCC